MKKRGFGMKNEYMGVRHEIVLNILFMAPALDVALRWMGF